MSRESTNNIYETVRGLTYKSTYHKIRVKSLIPIDRLLGVKGELSLSSNMTQIRIESELGMWRASSRLPSTTKPPPHVSKPALFFSFT